VNPLTSLQYPQEKMSNPSKQPFRVAVYCASASGKNPAHLAAAIALGQAIADSGFGLVYGGATVGLMGAVADSALASGAKVIGVLPKVLSGREIAHLNLTELIYTTTMHQRKATMIRLSDAIIALPGGYGTLDELMEAVTWSQLGIHNKPCILINTNGYYDGLLSFLNTAVSEGFLKPTNRKLLQVVSTPKEAVQLLRNQLSQS
jgi:uncharacterized protein (TIGR00730 family)